MLQHLQDEIEKSTIYQMLVTIEKKFNLQKMKEGEKNSGGYYHKMEDWYQKDMTELLGCVQNETKDGDELHLCIEGRQYLRNIYIAFDAYRTGEYKGIYMINKRRQNQKTEHLTRKQSREAITNEINQIIMDFSMKAYQLGYLV